MSRKEERLNRLISFRLDDNLYERICNDAKEARLPLAIRHHAHLMGISLPIPALSHR